jgi:hypothetical protein
MVLSLSSPKNGGGFERIKGLVIEGMGKGHRIGKLTNFIVKLSLAQAASVHRCLSLPERRT